MWVRTHRRNPVHYYPKIVGQCGGTKFEMDQIPVELIEKILSHENITIQDVCNFSASCKFFRQLVLNSSAIWKQKFRHKYG
mgnify:FL=1